MQNEYLKLINEFDCRDYDIITESIDNNRKQYKLRGPYFIANEENENGRYYPYEVLKPEIDAFIQNKVKKNLATCCGELEHPDYAYVNLQKVCHQITDLHETQSGKSTVWIGESKILHGTVNGDILTILLDQGLKVGLSSRGVGQMENNNSKRGPIKKYKLITVDCVSDPSIGRFADGILESKDFLLDTHGVILERSFAQLEENLEVLPKKSDDRAKVITDVFKTFLSSLRNQM